jgi:hypothetical protein
MGAGRKETLLTTKAGGEAGGEVPPVAELPRRKRTHCPLFGCTRMHAPENCPTFRDMMLKEAAVLVLLEAPDGQGV